MKREENRLSLPLRSFFFFIFDYNKHLNPLSSLSVCVCVYLLKRTTCPFVTFVFTTGVLIWTRHRVAAGDDSWKIRVNCEL